LLALTLRDAIDALEVDAAESVTLPREALPSRNVTVPVGAELPLTAVTFALSWTVPLAARVAGVAVTTVFVATGALVTVTVIVAEAPPKPPAAAYDALIEFVPTARLEPLTVIAALDELPEAISAVEPRATLPRVNVTAPDGGFDPLSAITSAVSCVVALTAMAAGLAVKVIAVPITEGKLCQLVTRL
jgi:hypothetical protein